MLHARLLVCAVGLALPIVAYLHSRYGTLHPNGSWSRRVWDISFGVVWLGIIPVQTVLYRHVSHVLRGGNFAFAVVFGETLLALAVTFVAESHKKKDLQEKTKKGMDIIRPVRIQVLSSTFHPVDRDTVSTSKKKGRKP